MKIKRKDLVKVITGKDSGKTGTVESVKNNKVVVKNINIYKKHHKPTSKSVKTGISEINMPIEISNIVLICKHCQKPTRVKYQMFNNQKSRVCKKCSEKLDE